MVGCQTFHLLFALHALDLTLPTLHSTQLKNSYFYHFIGSSFISLNIKSVNLPSGSINLASGLTKPSASFLIQPKNPYSNTQSVLSIQSANWIVNPYTSFLSRETDAISETMTGIWGCLLCMSSIYLMAALPSVP